MTPFERLDLNLLRLFEMVMREGSITRAGERLGMSQPAASKALKRFREYCGDPLFVRTSEGIKPTPVASAILPSVAATLASLQGTLDEYRNFDPARSSRAFTLLMLDVGELLFLPSLMAHLQQVAPGIRIVTRQTERSRYAADLASGEADMALGELPRGQPELIAQRLFEEPMVCIAAEGHPTIQGRLSRRQFIDTPQVALGEEPLIEAMLQRAMVADFRQRQVALEVKHFLVMPLIVASTALIAVIPQSVAETYRPAFRLQILPLPFRMEPVHVQQFWHRRSQHDVGHRWLRGEIARFFRR